MADIEIWKDIEGYEGLYQVSSLGRVRSLDREIVVLRGGNYYSKIQKGCIITNQKDTRGYNQVQLHKGTRKQVCTMRVCRLVANAFIPNPDNKPCIDHINTDREDDRVSNLRWVSYKENSENPLTIQHHQGTHKVPHIPNRKPVVQYSKDGIFIKKWASAEEAAAALSLTKSNIQSVAGHRPHSHTAGGYKWEYARKTPDQE